jgi:hypothetical protein
MASLLSSIESQSLSGIVAGFSFASAIAWMDVARWVIANIIKIPKTGGLYVFLTALFTTILAVLIYNGLQMVSPKLKQPSSPVYAVTAM